MAPSTQETSEDAEVSMIRERNIVATSGSGDQQKVVVP